MNSCLTIEIFHTEAMIVKTNTTHLQQDKYQIHRNSSISLVQMKTTYITNIQRIVYNIYDIHMKVCWLNEIFN